MHPEVKEASQYQAYGELDGCVKTPSMQNFPVGNRKKEGSFRWDCVVFLRPHVQSRFLPPCQNCPCPTILSVDQEHFPTCCLLIPISGLSTLQCLPPERICSHQWLSHPPGFFCLTPLTSGGYRWHSSFLSLLLPDLGEKQFKEILQIFLLLFSALKPKRPLFFII